MSDILIVDDECEIGEYLCKALEEVGLTGTFTARGEEALQLIERERFKIFVIDMRLSTPVTGLDVMKAIREKLPGAVIVGMSGYIDEHLKNMALRFGAHEYLEKPTDLVFDKFTAKMKQLLSKTD